jgi:hypothetical protein
MKKSIKLPKTKQLAFCVDKKMEAKLKKLTRQLKFKSISETVRHCIELTSVL